MHNGYRLSVTVLQIGRDDFIAAVRYEASLSIEIDSSFDTKISQCRPLSPAGQ
jgi:hypothetical protein